MRLGIKLFAFAAILLLPKTSIYFSNEGLAEAQLAPERPISGRTVDLKGPLPGCAEISAEHVRAQRALCAAADMAPRVVLAHVAPAAAGGQ